MRNVLAHAGRSGRRVVSAPRRLVATLGSFMNFGGYLAASAAPIITGFIVDQTGSFVLALVIAAGVAVFGAVANMLVVKDPIADDDELTLSPTSVWALRGVAVLVGAFSGYLIAKGLGAESANAGAGIGALIAAVAVLAIPALLKKGGAARSDA